MKKLVLASASPRRRDILSSAGAQFDVIVSEVDENINVCEPALLVKELALLKAAAVAKGLKHKSLVIGADTVVSINGKILGKPVDCSDAKHMLRLLSSRAHQVYTGVCVVDSSSGAAVCMHETTNVVFNNLSKKQIRDYIWTKEPLDKAGAYGIQGLGGHFVRFIIGDYNNVVGLPLNLLRRILIEEFGYQI